MARIRTIKPDFFMSERLAVKLPGPDGRQARLFFVGLWKECEDATGVCRGNAAFLKSCIYPYDEDVAASDVERWLGMLEAGGFILRYEINGSHYVLVRGFLEHQKIDRPSKPTLPTPPEPSPSPRRALAEPSLLEGKGREGSGRDSFPAPGGPEAEPRQKPLLPEVTQRPAVDTRARQKAGTDSRPDPRHGPLVEALVAAAPGYAFLGGRDAKAVKSLLELADADPVTRGDKAVAEVVRRWRICRAWVGFPLSRHLGDFATNWNSYAKTQVARSVRTDTTPSDFSRAPEGPGWEEIPEFDPAAPGGIT